MKLKEPEEYDVKLKLTADILLYIFGFLLLIYIIIFYFKKVANFAFQIIIIFFYIKVKPITFT